MENAETHPNIAAPLSGTAVAIAEGQPIVIDPAPGEEMPISQIDMTSPTDKQRADVTDRFWVDAACRGAAGFHPAGRRAVAR